MGLFFYCRNKLFSSYCQQRLPEFQFKHFGILGVPSILTRFPGQHIRVSIKPNVFSYIHPEMFYLIPFKVPTEFSKTQIFTFISRTEKDLFRPPQKTGYHDDCFTDLMTPRFTAFIISKTVASLIILLTVNLLQDESSNKHFTTLK